jgi:hypothetical protein
VRVRYASSLRLCLVIWEDCLEGSQGSSTTLAGRFRLLRPVTRSIRELSAQWVRLSLAVDGRGRQGVTQATACSFEQNAMELDTAARDTLPVLCIVSLKGGPIASPQAATE